MTTSTPSLVFGDDHSASSDIAWGWIDHASWPGWRLEVVHAQDSPIGPPVAPEESALHPWQPPDPRVPSTGASFAEVVNLTAKIDPRVALLRRADLLVIGPKGRGRLKMLNIGSVAEWLLTRPPSPLVIARQAAPVRSVLLATDGSRSADHTLRSLCALPWISSTTCTLVVVDDGRVKPDHVVGPSLAALEAAGVTTEVVACKGAPTGVIAGEIDRRKPDLAALGTSGLTGMRRFHLGSTASAIARSAPCSVLVACVDTQAD